MRFGEVEKAILLAAYQESLGNSGRAVSAGTLLDNYVIEPSEGWVHEIVADLGRRGLTHGKGVLGDERDQPLRLTASGMREAEQLIDQGFYVRERVQTGQKVGSAPAADRVVRFDHNSEPVVKAVNDSQQLAEQLLTANDVGLLTRDQADAASFEVTQIADALKQEKLRPSALWAYAQNTLRWVGTQAANAVIGAAALALLALLGSILGVGF